MTTERIRASRLLSYTSRSYLRYLSKHLKKYELGLSNYSTLLFLYHRNEFHPEGCSQAFIAKQTAQDKGLMSRNVKTLKAKGYIDIIVDPQNNSSNRVKITKEGKKIAKVIDDLIIKWEEEMWEVIAPKDRDAFERSIVAIFQHLGSEDEVTVGKTRIF